MCSSDLETRTCMFVLLLLFISLVLWSLQKLLDLGINSPKQLWSNLRSGNRKRSEARLQEALTTWIDEGEGNRSEERRVGKECRGGWET